MDPIIIIIIITMMHGPINIKLRKQCYALNEGKLTGNISQTVFKP